MEGELNLTAALQSFDVDQLDLLSNHSAKSEEHKLNYKEGETTPLCKIPPLTSSGMKSQSYKFW